MNSQQTIEANHTGNRHQTIACARLDDIVDVEVSPERAGRGRPRRQDLRHHAARRTSGCTTGRETRETATTGVTPASGSPPRRTHRPQRLNITHHQEINTKDHPHHTPAHDPVTSFEHATDQTNGQIVWFRHQGRCPPQVIQRLLNSAFNCSATARITTVAAEGYVGSWRDLPTPATTHPDPVRSVPPSVAGGQLGVRTDCGRSSNCVAGRRRGRRPAPARTASRPL